MGIFALLIGTYLLCTFHNLFLYERLLLKKKYALYIILGTTVIFLWTFLIEITQPFTLEGWVNTFVGGVVYALFGFGLYMIFQQVYVSQWKLKSDLSKTQNELAQLRAQLNPHFLFNALNNLYGTSISNAPKVPEYILMLSELLRYQIESTKHDKVLLAHEIKFIEQYMHYETTKLAHRGNIQLRIDVPQNTLMIAPLILFQFVENAVKFSSQEAEPNIHLHIELTGNDLSMQCINSFNPTLRKNLKSTQTGILNVRHRLELQYNNLHALAIHESDNRFNVNLKLSLTHGTDDLASLEMLDC